MNFRETIIHNLNKYPEMPSRTMARMIYAQNPQAWKSIDNIRAVIRYYRGALGKPSRKNIEHGKQI